MSKGIVYLIGAGPGDPGLITMKAADRIGSADVVVYDFLANPALLALAREDAELIYVGKKGGDHTLSQDKINDLIVHLALNGKKVARLKGGDPFVFGRGGEEAEDLVAAGVAFEVIPGVSSAIAAPAYAGIPVTHRDHTSNVGFITGHEDPAKETSSLDWNKIATAFGTLVFLMGVKNLPQLTKNLMDGGRDPATPAALVRWGTTPQQETLVATLGNIADKAREAGMKPPAVLVVGEVVSLRDRLNWFETRPLFGRKIMVTRTREQASRLTAKLADLGATVIECPTISIHPPQDFAPVDDAILHLADYDWLVLTSPNGVDMFFKRVDAIGLDSRSLHPVKIAAIGPATADKLKENGIRTDLLPEKFVAEGLVEALKGQDMSGRKVLLARAKEARDVLPKELARAGAEVTEVALYETRAPDGLPPDAETALNENAVDLVTFTSSSTVTNFVELMGPDRTDFTRRVPAACIGPITSDTARENGLNVAAEAAQYTIDGLVDAVVNYFMKTGTHA
jgi:uroporphyrinogen III methyltransferase/synthase